MAEVSTGREPRPWVVGCAPLVVLALHAAADPRPPEGVWGAVGVLAFSPQVRWLLLVLAALLALPPVFRLRVRVGSPPARRTATALAGVPAWM